MNVLLGRQIGQSICLFFEGGGFLNYPNIRQHNARDCGAACLAMIASFYGAKHPISKFRELTKTDRSGTNLYGIVDGALHIGLEAEALSGTPEELMESLSAGDISFPFVAHIETEVGMLHFVVVFEEKDGHLLIGDPGKGQYKCKIQSFFEKWTGYIVTFQKTENFKEGNYSKNQLISFFALLQGQYLKLASILIVSLIVAAIGIAGSFVFEVTIDGFISPATQHETDNYDLSSADEHEHEGFIGFVEKNIEWLSKSSIKKFDCIFILVIVLYSFQGILQFVRGYLIISVARIVDVRLVMKYYNHLIDLPLSSISVRQTGEYLSRFSDADAIRNAISNATLTIVFDSVMVIACGIILFTFEWKLALISLIIIIMYTGIALIYKKPIEKSNRTVMEKNAETESFLKESIDGIEAIKAMCASEQIKEINQKKYLSLVNSVFSNGLISISQDVLASMVELIGTVFILWVGFAMVLSGHIKVGALLTFYVLLGYFISPIKNLIELQPTIQTAFVAADRLHDVLDLSTEDRITSIDSDNLGLISEWNIQNLNFRYGNNEILLRDINLNIKRGEKIAVVGESGCGKTTFAKLLMRFYEPESGEILADGKSIKDISINDLRRAISYINQEPFLFADSIMNNIRLGNANMSDKDIILACQLSHASEFIERFPMGYETVLEEDGANLSTGQKQRISIARAILRKPQLLIIDEATSNLDVLSEKAIKDAIFNLNNNLTCIIITHRLSTIKDCDCIYVMENGQIIEYGTHEELMNHESKYFALWNMQ